MFLQTFSEKEIISLITAVALLGVGVLLLKIILSLTRVERRTDMKWVAISFFIQFGIAIFISAPMALDKILIRLSGAIYEGPKTPVVVPTIIIGVFILINFVNMLHKPGIKQSIVITLFVVGPIIGSIYQFFTVV